MGASFGYRWVAAVVDGQEDVCRLGEIGKGFPEGLRIRGLDQHERHAGAQEDDIAKMIVGEILAFEVSERRDRVSQV